MGNDDTLRMPPVDNFELVEVDIVRNNSQIIEIKKILPEINFVIAGGMARHLCSPLKRREYPSDVDLYFKTGSDFEAAKSAFKFAGFTVERGGNYVASFGSPKPLCGRRTQDNDQFYFGSHQLVRPEMLGLENCNNLKYDVLKTFDLTVCRVVLEIDSKLNVRAFADRRFLEHEKSLKAEFEGFTDPVRFISRICKYKLKGYEINLERIATLYKLAKEKYPEKNGPSVEEFIKALNFSQNNPDAALKYAGIYNSSSSATAGWNRFADDCQI